MDFTHRLVPRSSSLGVWTDDPEHRSTYLRWAVAYQTALIVIIAIFYYEGTPMTVLIIVLKTIVAS